KRFSIQSNRSEVLFVDYMVEHLTPNGKAAIIVPEGIIFQSGNAYKQLRKMLVENYLFAVVSLPAGVFQPYSGVKTSILLIDKALNKKTDKILFVKIENDGFDLGAQRRPNNKSQLLIAVRLVKEYITVCHTERSRSVNDIESILTEKFGPNNLWNIATKAKIAENDDWNLSSERYAKELYISTSYPLVKLKDLENNKKISFLRGSGISKKDIAENGKYKCIHYGDLYTKYDIVIQTVDSYTDIEGKVLSEKGDVLVPSTTTADALGISIARALNEDNVVLGGDINIIRTYNEHLNSKYLAYLISTPPLKIALSKYAKGTNILHLSNKDLEQLQIPLPPLEIQKEIVAEIEGWQKIIDGARQVVDNYKPQIDIAPEWPMVELGEVAYIISGQSPEGKYYNQEGEGMPFYQGKTEFGDMYIGEPKSWTTQITKEADAGDIVMSVRAPVGPVNFLICKSCIGRGLAAIKVTEKIDKIFLFNYIKSIEQNIKGGGGSVFDSINRKQISEIKIPLPDLIIQLEISESLKKEQLFVKANSELITLFEQKIKDKIAKVWGE
ncbi:MAG: restriction endonuclease subunit S, partial [Ignavibacteriales bacterium]|nr:restriction endonuclease subunit S [Ignavibacteriales bacterium]